MKDVVLRIGAVFILGALGTIGAASLFHINPIIGAGIAGILATQDVIKDLAKAFLDDGKLSKQEINDAFSKALNKKENK